MRQIGGIVSLKPIGIMSNSVGMSTGQIEANEIGLAILPSLRELDEVAYLRFASVYQAFDSLEDFEVAVQTLRSERQTGQAQ